MNYRHWALRIVTWDAALPACIALVPVAIGFYFPKREEPLIAAAALPLVAFLIRYRAGKRHIALNRCSRPTQRLQFCFFCFGIMVLALLDCFLMLLGMLPNGAVFKIKGDLNIWVVLVSLYLGSMIIAMYPGRSERPDMHEFTVIDHRWIEGA